MPKTIRMNITRKPMGNIVNVNQKKSTSKRIMTITAIIIGNRRKDKNPQCDLLYLL
jgi:hypothetical protein